MNTGAMITSILAEVEHSGSARGLREAIFASRPTLMQGADVPMTLLGALIAHSGDDWPPAAQLLEILLDEARMDVENDGALGAGFLSSLEDSVSQLVDKGQLTAEAGNVLARCYGRAQVEVPDALIRLRLAEIEQGLGSSGNEPPDFDQAIADLARAGGGNHYVMYEGLQEATAGWPVEAKAAFIHELSLHDSAISWSIATYSLLDQAVPIREAAAFALLNRTKKGEYDGAVIRQLPMLRSWMPADSARAIIDEANREIRRKNLKASPSPRAAKPRQIRASLPDGVGGQSFVIAARRKLGLILTKTGHGIKDAYVMECGSEREAREMLDRINEVEPLDVTLDTVAQALSAALADGLANDLPPAHGLIDVAGQFGLEAVRPHAMTPEEWLRGLDPEGEVRALPARKRSTLVNQSRHWLDRFSITESWFEDNAETRELLHSAADETEQEKLLWSYFEDRREYWAIRILQTGLVVKGAGEDWMSLAATAGALLDGYPLAKIPVMRDIAQSTLAAFHYQQEPGGAIEIDINQPASDEAVRGLLDAVGMAETAPAWLDGYLTAVVIAPKMPEPNIWVGGLMEETAGPVNPETVQSFLGVVFARYNGIGSGLMAQSELRGFAGLTDEDLRAWARGFELATRVDERAWKARSLKRDDKNMIGLIGSIAADTDLGFDPKGAIGKWVATRFDKQHGGT